MAKIKNDDDAMSRIREIFDSSGKTLDEVGQDMGYSKDVARKAVWQFLKTSDPRLSMLRKFAKAMDTSVEELIAEKKSRSK